MPRASRNPYDSPLTVFGVFLCLAFGSSNALQAVMLAGEDTPEMLTSTGIAAVNFGALWVTRYLLDWSERTEESV
jgi:hypothetical protein